MEYSACFGARKAGDGITFFHKNADVRLAEDAHLLHTHRELELYFCFSGDCDFITESGRFHLKPGSLVLTHPWQLHSIGVNADCNYDRYYIRIPKDWFSFLQNESASPLALLPRDARFVALPPEAATQAKNCLEEMETRLTEKDEGRALSLFFRLCAFAADALARKSGEEEDLLHPIVRRTVDHIHKNFARIDSVASVARMMGVSAAYLSRLFRANMKTTVTAYLRFKRMEHAKKLLREGVSLVAVCGECGCDDYSYFIAEFRRATGTTPVKYQKAHTKQE